MTPSAGFARMALDGGVDRHDAAVLVDDQVVHEVPLSARERRALFFRTVTQGELRASIPVEPGTWVRCIDVKAGRVLVRPVDKPDLGELENANFE